MSIADSIEAHKRVKNLTGRRFGKWVVRDFVGVTDGIPKAAKWRCICDCGNEGVIFAGALISGNSKSCGKGECAQRGNPKTRFMKYVQVVDGCWIWTGTRHGKGYGHFRFKGKIEKAQRVAYKMFIGEIPDGLLVCHSCDNPPCVNPDHLWLGTNADNSHDRDTKGRWRDWVAMKRNGEHSIYVKPKHEDLQPEE